MMELEGNETKAGLDNFCCSEFTELVAMKCTGQIGSVRLTD